jgi:hypothetical protein
MLALAPISAIAAQDQARAGAPTTGSEIVMTGFRKGELELAAAKKHNFVVSDLIVSGDIDRVPDHNTAVALRFQSIRGVPPNFRQQLL